MDLLTALAAGLVGLSLCDFGVRVWRSRRSAIGGGFAGVAAVLLGTLLIAVALVSS